MKITRLTDKCRQSNCGEGYGGKCNLCGEIKPYPGTGICYDNTELWETYDFIGEAKDFETCVNCVVPIGFNNERAINYGGKINGCGLCKNCFEKNLEGMERKK